MRRGTPRFGSISSCYAVDADARPNLCLECGLEKGAAPRTAPDESVQSAQRDATELMLTVPKAPRHLWGHICKWAPKARQGDQEMDTTLNKTQRLPLDARIFSTLPWVYRIPRTLTPNQTPPFQQRGLRDVGHAEFDGVVAHECAALVAFPSVTLGGERAPALAPRRDHLVWVCLGGKGGGDSFALGGAAQAYRSQGYVSFRSRKVP